MLDISTFLHAHIHTNTHMYIYIHIYIYTYNSIHACTLKYVCVPHFPFSSCLQPILFSDLDVRLRLDGLPICNTGVFLFSDDDITEMSIRMCELALVNFKLVSMCRWLQ
jgi:hypothetical protein